jgi:integrase
MFTPARRSHVRGSTEPSVGKSAEGHERWRDCQHAAQPETVEKLRWLLSKAVSAFGELRLAELEPHEIAAWRMNDVNPAKQGVDNPQRRRAEKRPFESWAQLADVAGRLGEIAGPMVLFAAATGLRPGEWIALEWRDVDLQARVLYVRRAYRNGNVKCTKTEASVRAVPLQAIALDALAQVPIGPATDLVRVDAESMLCWLRCGG